MAIPLMIHAFLMGLYVFMLVVQQYGMIMGNLTTNERINMFKYHYLRAEDGSFLNPFDQVTHTHTHTVNPILTVGSFAMIMNDRVDGVISSPSSDVVRKLSPISV